MPADSKYRPSKKMVIGSLIGIFLLLGVVGSGAPKQQSQQSPPTAQQPTGKVEGVSTTQASPIETKTVTETEAIPYQTQNIDDWNLDSGKTATATSGVNGEKTITYQVTYTDGKETSRTKIGEQVTKQPVNQVNKVGTKVATPAPSCPNGSYVNAAGNTVCNPYATSTSAVPAGATAQCQDGTYSFSQSRRGTCSHHGGVATWY